MGSAKGSVIKPFVRDRYRVIGSTSVKATAMTRRTALIRKVLLAFFVGCTLAGWA